MHTPSLDREKLFRNDCWRKAHNLRGLKFYLKGLKINMKNWTIMSDKITFQVSSHCLEGLAQKAADINFRENNGRFSMHKNI